ncbi:basic helix-loop-helix (bHLH) DNA-binding superfamily protein [Euphorbia peplus]|nr:basic helix-loop-helix (bHLH) DNA-binding superfamily protein [Euphorbia peplus]
MDENEGDQFREVGITTSFSQLLFSDVCENDVFCSDLGPLPSVYDDDGFFSSKSPKMLCFDGYNNSDDQKSVVTCSESLPDSSATTTAAGGVNVNVNTPATKPNRRRNGSEKKNPAAIAKAAATSTQRSSKKMKTENPCISTAQPKAKKEKLGERIAVLQQLVSPFGKTDTASVLHEAMGYIKFLHEQLQVLCSPYLQHLPPEDKENGGEQSINDLRSRGLCLVPVDCTLHVASTNGADFWSPAMSSTRQ